MSTGETSKKNEGVQNVVSEASEMRAQERAPSVLYLVQRDLAQVDRNGAPKLIATIGRVIRFPDGYRFSPENVAHGRSRKPHPTANKAIPAWAHKLAEAKGFGDLLTYEDLDRARAAR